MLTLVGGGLSNDEVAAALVISIKAAKTHLTRLPAKLRARDRAQLVIAAYDSGLVRPRVAQPIVSTGRSRGDDP